MQTQLHTDIIQLIQQAKAGDQKATDEIVEKNLGLVWSVVHRFSGRGVESEDLFQIGCIGLLKAVRRFDESYGVVFSTYAVPMIMGEIKRFLRDNGSIKVSRRLKELAAKAYGIREKQKKQTGEDISIGELADMLGVDREELVQAMDSCAPVASLNATFDGEEEGATLENILTEGGIEEATLQRISVEEMLEKLKEDDRKLIELRYFQNKTQIEVATFLSISQVQVSRKERKILKFLRSFM
jgi:RNA polymerase sporulation-specific sigma factor